MLCNLSWIYDNPFFCDIVQYIDQSYYCSLHVLGFDTLRFSRLITDWSVENMNPDMTPYRMLYVSVLPKKGRKK